MTRCLSPPLAVLVLLPGPPSFVGIIRTRAIRVSILGGLDAYGRLLALWVWLHVGVPQPSCACSHSLSPYLRLGTHLCYNSERILPPVPDCKIRVFLMRSIFRFSYARPLHFTTVFSVHVNSSIQSSDITAVMRLENDFID